MARPVRLLVPGEVHLLSQHGHNGQPVFRDDDDRRRYLDDLREVCAVNQVALHAYALLDDRVCLLATPSSAEGVSRLMQGVGRRYVVWHNRRHGRSGTLWEGRFRAVVIDAAEHATAALRYVDSLPLRGGVAPDLLATAWSSAAHHLGVRRDRLLSDPVQFWALGNTPFEREALYRQALLQGLSGAEWRRFDEALVRGGALGPSDFIRRLEGLVQRSLVARPRGRPRREPNNSGTI
jgi:putative transposase